MGFRTYLWDRRRSWLLALGLLAVLLMVLLLFRLPVLAVGYGALLCGVIYLGAGIWDFVQWSRRHHRLQNLEQEVLSTLDNLPPPGSSLEEDYQRLLVSLFRAKAAQSAESSSRFQNMTDYYTLWAHQIKTPIAAMDLILQTQELPESGSLKQSLFQIQQYVEMVLCYLRLDSETTDFVIRRLTPGPHHPHRPAGVCAPPSSTRACSCTTRLCPAPSSPMRSGSSLFWSSSCPTP